MEGRPIRHRPCAGGPEPTSIQESGRQTRLPSLCQSNVPGKRGRPRRRRRLLGPRADRDERGCNSEPGRSRKRAYLPRPLLTAREPVVALCLRKVHTGGGRPAPRECRDASRARRRATETSRAEFRRPTLRIHPFTSRRFHVLLNSLFKVLFNFPSRYLSAIGLVPVFSLRWSLPPALGCIPKQPDSGDARSRPTSCQQRPDTRSGRGPDQEDFGHRCGRQLASHTPQFPQAVGWGIRCWACPASLAVTEGILVSFFSSA